MGKITRSLITLVDTIRTVSDTKRNFYTYHSRPINSIYRRVVEELMVEMHLLSVNTNFSYNPIYALGVVTTYDRFMEGYRPEKDKEPIFEALCRSIDTNPKQYREDAFVLNQIAQELSLEKLVSWNTTLVSLEGGEVSVEGGEKLYECLKEIAFNPSFKYSRLFGIGLYSLMEIVASESTTELNKTRENLTLIGEGLNLPIEKMLKDLELYKSNIEKMEQAKQVIEDTLKADRKKREQPNLEKKESINYSGS